MAMLKVRVNPRSSRNRITGRHGGILSVRLTAPPIEGAANKAAIEFLADQLRLRKAQITLVSGDKSRDKIFEIRGVTQPELDALLAALVAAPQQRV